MSDIGPQFRDQIDLLEVKVLSSCPVKALSALAFLTIAVLCNPLSASAAPTHAMPSPWPLVAKMSAAMTKAGTAHGVGTSTLWVTRHSGKTTMHRVDSGAFSGDATTSSSDRSQIRERLISKSEGSTVSLTVDYATKNKTVATHVEGQKPGWKCGDANTVLNSIDVWTPASFAIGKITKETAAKNHLKVWVAGSTTYNGVAVWKIQTSSSASSSKTKIKEQETYSILVDKSDSLVPFYSWTLASQGPGGAGKMSSSIRLTKYGEKANLSMHGC